MDHGNTFTFLERGRRERTEREKEKRERERERSAWGFSFRWLEIYFQDLMYGYARSERLILLTIL